MKKEQETKKDYESPLTKETQVEMEGSLCGSIEAKTEENGVRITSQDVGTPGTREDGTGKYNDFSNTEWGKIE